MATGRATPGAASATTASSPAGRFQRHRPTPVEGPDSGALHGLPPCIPRPALDRKRLGIRRRGPDSVRIEARNSHEKDIDGHMAVPFHEPLRFSRLHGQRTGQEPPKGTAGAHAPTTAGRTDTHGIAWSRWPATSTAPTLTRQIQPWRRPRHPRPGCRDRRGQCRRRRPEKYQPRSTVPPAGYQAARYGSIAAPLPPG